MSSQAKQVIESLPGAFLPEKAGNAKALIQLDLTGEGGGQWALDIADGRCNVVEGLVPNPDVTLTMTADNFVALHQGTLNPVSAFMGGKIKVSGNVGQVMNLMYWFKR